MTVARRRAEVGRENGIILDATLQPLRLRQLVQQRFRFLQIGGVEPLGEPAVDRGEEVVGFG